MKNYDSFESQQALSIPQATKSPDNPNVKLVIAVNCGGLWVILNDAEKLFILFEKYFCAQYARKDLHKIHVNMINKNFTELLLCSRLLSEYPSVSSVESQ